MKKLLLFLFLFFIPFSICASEKVEVKFKKCVDGDTAWVYINNKEVKLRFLAIDTPESTNKVEPYGKIASSFTCNHLSNASKIEVEYDNNSDKFDKYGRHLVWIFADNELLQELIVKEGLADIKYIYGKYKYLDILYDDLKLAKKQKLNLWSNNDYMFIFQEYQITKELFYSIIIFIFLSISCIFNKKLRKTMIKKLKKIK